MLKFPVFLGRSDYLIRSKDGTLFTIKMEHQKQHNLVPKALLPLRAEIDIIDHQILELLGKRNAVVEKVAAVKKTTGFGIRDFTREKELLQDRGARAQSAGLRSEVIESLFRVILWASRDRQAARRRTRRRRRRGAR